ncbi:MAG: 50S ribosomal protein L15 [Planctomycetales bacterium]
MMLHDVNEGIQKYKKRKRLGRGLGSGHGKTCGRGHKGQKSRAGHSAHPTFQGGAMPLVRRIPKRGFNNQWAKIVRILNLGDFEQHFEDGAEINLETLRETGRLKGACDLLKILGNGDLTKKLKISAHRFSKSALEKIQAAGGEAIVLAPRHSGPKEPKRKSKKS